MRCSALPAVLLLCATVRLGGQEPCDSLVARAFNEFDANRRLQLLVPALDPSACPPRGSWVVGMQLLVESTAVDIRMAFAGSFSLVHTVHLVAEGGKWKWILPAWRFRDYKADRCPTDAGSNPPPANA